MVIYALIVTKLLTGVIHVQHQLPVQLVDYQNINLKQHVWIHAHKNVLLLVLDNIMEIQILIFVTYVIPNVWLASGQLLTNALNAMEPILLLNTIK